MASHSSILAWEVPGTEEPGGLQSWGHKRVGHNLATKHHIMFARGLLTKPSKNKNPNPKQTKIQGVKQRFSLLMGGTEKSCGKGVFL